MAHDAALILTFLDEAASPVGGERRRAVFWVRHRWRLSVTWRRTCWPGPGIRTASVTSIAGHRLHEAAALRWLKDVCACPGGGRGPVYRCHHG